MHKPHRWLIPALTALGLAVGAVSAQAATLLDHSPAASSGERFDATPFTETPEANAPPEFGRCIKTTGGAYEDGVCTTSVGAGKGAYEWYAAFGSAHPLEKAGFTNALKEEGGIVMETVGKLTVTCGGESAIGEYTGNKTVGGVVVTFSSCSSSGGACSSAGAGSGTIVTQSLEGELGVIEAATESAKTKVGEDLFPTGHRGPVAQFTCNGFKFNVTGAAIGNVPTNTMKTTAVVKFVQSKGKQKPESFEGGSTTILSTTIGEGLGEQSGMAFTASQTSEEKIEINSVV
jgi:hypothetical protein